MPGEPERHTLISDDPAAPRIRTRLYVGRTPSRSGSTARWNNAAPIFPSARLAVDREAGGGASERGRDQR
jgi:hypothetical protein